MNYRFIISWNYGIQKYFMTYFHGTTDKKYIFVHIWLGIMDNSMELCSINVFYVIITWHYVPEIHSSTKLLTKSV